MIGIGGIVTRRGRGEPNNSLSAMDSPCWDVLFVSLSLLHNVDRNDTWGRPHCGAGGTRPCHLLIAASDYKNSYTDQERDFL